MTDISYAICNYEDVCYILLCLVHDPCDDSSACESDSSSKVLKVVGITVGACIIIILVIASCVYRYNRGATRNRQVTSTACNQNSQSHDIPSRNLYTNGIRVHEMQVPYTVKLFTLSNTYEETLPPTYETLTASSKLKTQDKGYHL